MSGQFKGGTTVKRWLSMLLALCMVWTMIVPALAESVSDTEELEAIEEAEAVEVETAEEEAEALDSESVTDTGETIANTGEAIEEEAAEALPYTKETEMVEEEVETLDNESVTDVEEATEEAEVVGQETGANPIKTTAMEDEEAETVKSSLAESEEQAELTGTNGHSSSDAVDWARSKVGLYLDYDGAYGAQCVDLMMYYYAYLGQPISFGNAEAYRYNALPSGWSRYTYTTDFVLKPGDIAVWKPASDNGYYGHVGIVTSAWSRVSSNPSESVEFSCINQNAWPYYYCHEDTYNASVLACT